MCLSWVVYPIPILPFTSPSLHTSFTLWLTWVAPPASYIWQTGISFRRSSLAATACLTRKMRFHMCVRLCLCHPPLPLPPKATPLPLWLRHGFSNDGVMGCGEKEPLYNSALSLTGPGGYNPSPPPSPFADSLLFFPVVFSFPGLRGRGKRNSILRHLCAHPSICPSTTELQTTGFPPQVIASVED